MEADSVTVLRLQAAVVGRVLLPVVPHQPDKIRLDPIQVLQEQPRTQVPLAVAVVAVAEAAAEVLQVRAVQVQPVLRRKLEQQPRVGAVAVVAELRPLALGTWSAIRRLTNSSCVRV